MKRKKKEKEENKENEKGKKEEEKGKKEKKEKEEIVEENLQPSSQSAPILSTVGKKKHLSYEYTCPILYYIHMIISIYKKRN